MAEPLLLNRPDDGRAARARFLGERYGRADCAACAAAAEARGLVGLAALWHEAALAAGRVAADARRPGRDGGGC